MVPRRADSRPSNDASLDNNNNSSTSSEGFGGYAKQFAFEVLLTAVSAALSYLVLQAVAKHGPGAIDKTQDPKRNAAAARKRLSQQPSANNGSSTALKDVKFNEYEDIIAGDMVFPEEIDVTFADIGGHDQDKREIYDLICLPLKHPDVFARLSNSELLSPPRGILLFGPPGTGKTMMAKAIAKESGAAFINLKMSTTMNLYFGESQKLVRATFSLARKLSPCIIFIDEIDSFLHERKSDDNSALGNMKAEFMALWDGMESDPSNEGRRFGVVIIGATNRPWDVDAAILRRMPRTFEMGLPDEKEREKVLRLVLRSERLDPLLDLKQLARSCIGYSGSDLKEMCRAAATIPYREFASGFNMSTGTNPIVETGIEDMRAQIRPLRWEDFEVARKNVRPSGETASQYHEKMQHAKAGANRNNGNAGWTNPLDHDFNSASAEPPSHQESFLAGVQYGLSLANARQSQDDQYRRKGHADTHTNGNGTDID
jgi:SpoVK/Ycf46/Vps4 family AAA+-type ATPase